MNSLFEVLWKSLPDKRTDLIRSKNITVTFINPYSYWIARKQDSQIYASFDFICFDGIIFALIIKLLCGRDSPRISFDMTSLAPDVFKFSVETKRSLYFIGSTQDNIEKFVRVFKMQYPKANCIGYRSGFFRMGEKNKMIKDLSSISPDIIIVGMGTPYQDMMITELREVLPNTTFYSCGGFFHQSIDRVKYYPDWIDKCNLRWVYRIYDEPKLFKRYILYYPMSIVHFTYSCLKYRLKYGKNI